MPNLWMVRAERGGRLAQEFWDKRCVAIGFCEDLDLTELRDRQQVRSAAEKYFADRKPGQIPVFTGVVLRFRLDIKLGDWALSYESATREYLVGVITGDYTFRPGVIPGMPHTRAVDWKTRFSRDLLSPSSRNTLGSAITLFEPGNEVLSEIKRVIEGKTAPSAPAPTEPVVDRIREELFDKAHEFIKDRLSKLDWDEMQELVAAVLRAMGYKTRVSPQGSDRGKDIVASPDGLGLEQPRIKVEVKHRNGQMGSDKIRSFLGGLRGDDRGMYVSTGGFTKEALYEAERATIPTTLLDLDDLTTLLVQH